MYEALSTCSCTSLRMLLPLHGSCMIAMELCLEAITMGSARYRVHGNKYECSCHAVIERRATGTYLTCKLAFILHFVHCISMNSNIVPTELHYQNLMFRNSDMLPLGPSSHYCLNSQPTGICLFDLHCSIVPSLIAVHPMKQLKCFETRYYTTRKALESQTI